MKQYFLSNITMQSGWHFHDKLCFFIQQKCDAAQVLCDCFGPKKADAVD